MKLEINNKRTGKFPITWKLNTMIQNNKCIKDKSKGKKNLETNKNENAMETKTYRMQKKQF